MRDQVVIAPDKFKGSLSARQVADHLAAGLLRFRPDLRLRLTPIADGGDGTLEAVISKGFSSVPVTVSGPTGQPVEAAFGIRDRTAVVELAQASGLRRLSGGRLDPMAASSRGTGELVRAALEADCDQVIIGLGGSACTDGGAGMLQALGAALIDRHGHELRPGGAALIDLAGVDLSQLHPRLASAQIVLAGDVDNPLLGLDGAAAVYAPQKGAGPGQVAELERALRHWAGLLAEATGQDRSAAAGAGAAGGVGFAALSVLDAELRSGIQVILELIDFGDELAAAALVITGEGSLDRQSLHGKAPVGVAGAAAELGVPTIAVAGQCSLRDAELRSAGLLAAYPLTSLEPDPAVCMARAGPLLRTLAATVIGPNWLTDHPRGCG